MIPNPQPFERMDSLWVHHHWRSRSVSKCYLLLRQDELGHLTNTWLAFKNNLCWLYFSDNIKDPLLPIYCMWKENFEPVSTKEKIMISVGRLMKPCGWNFGLIYSVKGPWHPVFHPPSDIHEAYIFLRLHQSLCYNVSCLQSQFFHEFLPLFCYLSFQLFYLSWDAFCL